MSGNSRRLIVEDTDDENDMDYEPSETATQETREGTAATESGNGHEETAYLGIDDLRALLRRAAENAGFEGLIQEMEDDEDEEEQGGMDDDEDEDEDEEDEDEDQDEELGDQEPESRDTIEFLLDADGWGDEDDESEHVFTLGGNTFRVSLPMSSRRRQRYANRSSLEANLEPVPSEAGRELMGSGDFGYYEFPTPSPRKRRRSSDASVDEYIDIESPTAGSSPEHSQTPPDPRSPTSHKYQELSQNDASTKVDPQPEASFKRQKTLIGRRLLLREMGIHVGEPAKIVDSLVLQSMIPTNTEKVLHFDARCYSGQFSEDGDFFYCCSQDMIVRMYDTTNPHEWKYYKKAEYPGGHWTITDATLSPDNKQLAYSSLDSMVYMARTHGEGDFDEDPTPIDFANGPRQYSMRNGVPIWSIRFSGDGRELIAGAKDRSLYAYDIERGEPVMKLTGHDNDVNAVCYGDKSSPHILFSGSDDCTIKIWDRRSMASGREAGAFLGHIEGLTYIDSKGDGRYVLSNGKDQTMKLWDIRKMMDRAEYERTGLKNYSTNFDYRFESYDYYPIRKHPQDNSVVTFRGHRVLKTLIRCHFSPPNSSGSRYVYTGSEDGRVFIYNLDATIAAVIDVQESTLDHQAHHRNSLHGIGYFRGHPPTWETCTRDVSWHPNAPVIASTSWNGYGASQGSVAVHEWDGKIRGEGLTRNDFGFWNKDRDNLRKAGRNSESRETSPVRTDEELLPLRRRTSRRSRS